MAIVRVPKVNNYTIMSNHHLIDTELSFNAKGLMSYMLSRPDNWDFTIEGLAHQNKEGADAIARIIRELEERGYIIRCRVRNQAGKFTDMEYKILEFPLKKAAAERKETDQYTGGQKNEQEDSIYRIGNSHHHTHDDGERDGCRGHRDAVALLHELFCAEPFWQNPTEEYQVQQRGNNGINQDGDE